MAGRECPAATPTILWIIRKDLNMITSSNPGWRTSVKLLRVACPLAFVVAVALGWTAWTLARFELVTINAFLAGINLVLGWVNWRVFKL